MYIQLYILKNSCKTRFRTTESIMNCTIHLFKDQPEDGPTIGPKNVAGIITWYNLIKCKIVYDYLFLFHSQPNIPQTSRSGTHTHIDNIQPHTK